MKKPAIVLAVFAACLVVPVARMVGQDKEPVKELLPHHGVWKLEMDDKIDGSLDPRSTGSHEFKLSVVNNRLVGRNTDPKWANEGHMTGDIVTGDPTPLVFIRQDRTAHKGGVTFYCGKLTKDGVCEGTYYANTGGTGDFRFTLQKAE